MVNLRPRKVPLRHSNRNKRKVVTKPVNNKNKKTGAHNDKQKKKTTNQGTKSSKNDNALNISSRTLRLMNRNKKQMELNDTVIKPNQRDIPVPHEMSIENDDSTITIVDIESTNTNVLESDTRKKTNVEIPMIQPVREKRKATKVAMESIGEIATMDMLMDSLENKSDDEFMAGLMSDTKQKTIHVPIPNLPNTDIDMFTDILANNDNDNFSTTVDDNSTINASPSFESKINKMIITTQQNDDRIDATNCTPLIGAEEISDIDDIVYYFRISKRDRYSIASEDQRSMDKDIESSNIRGWLGMIRLATICTNKIIDVICPGPSKGALRVQLGNRLISQKRNKLKKKDIDIQYEKLIDTIFNVLKKM